MVTLKDIAKECNVSFSTVSKALKGSSEISEETINLIQKKASEMGYHPNIAARTLRTSKTYNIGVIFEDKTGAGFQHQYFAKIISGFQDVAQSRDYEITFMSYHRNKENDYYNHSRSRNFDGVAILSADFTKKGIKEDNFPKIIGVYENVEDIEVVGCCTDICIQNFAIALRNFFDELNMDVEIIVPKNAVETFHIPEIHDREENNKENIM